MTLPQHVIARLIDQGFWTERDTTRRAQARRCRKCSRGVISGLDDDVAALDVDVDPVPLSEAGELAAILAGRRTYGLMPGTRRVTLEARSRSSLRRPGLYILVEHDCSVVPQSWRAPAPPAPASQPDSVPF